MHFCKRVFYLVLGSFLATAIVGTYVAVSGDPPNADHMQCLEAEERALKSKMGPTASQEDRRHLASIYWQENQPALAAKIFTTLWKEEKPQAEKYNSQFVDDALALAAVYFDLAAYQQALDCYNSVLQYEQSRLPAQDHRIARDLNNLGLVNYLCGCCCDDRTRRLQYFNLARDYYERAEKMLTQNNGHKTCMKANLMNKCLVLRELGLSDQARRVRAAADAIPSGTRHVDYQL
jgi:tetratricopeptide (TPR) repeat protein